MCIYENEIYLSVLSWSINGTGDKLVLSDQHIIKSHDILGCVETMKSDTFRPQIPGYQTYHFACLKIHENAKRDSGGILILVSNKIPKYVSVQRESDSVVWVKLHGKYLSLPSDISIGFVYIPPDGSTHAAGDTDIFDVLQSKLDRSKDRWSFVEILTLAQVNC